MNMHDENNIENTNPFCFCLKIMRMFPYKTDQVVTRWQQSISIPLINRTSCIKNYKISNMLIVFFFVGERISGFHGQCSYLVQVL